MSIPSFKKWYKTLAAILLAFPLPLSIHSPEWPPKSPLTSKTYTGESLSSPVICFVIIKSFPPEDDVHVSPSVSLSKPIILLADNWVSSTPNAPNNPTSSCTVKTHSRGGCFKESSVKIANM